MTQDVLDRRISFFLVGIAVATGKLNVLPVVGGLSMKKIVLVVRVI